MAFTMTGSGTATGLILYAYLSDEVPNGAFAYRNPAHVVANDVKPDPIFISPNRTLAKRWRFYSRSESPAAFSVPVPYGQVEYIMMTTPLGVVYAYGLGDDGNFYLQQFENGVPYNRQLVSVVMHKGSLIFVADNRQPIPKPGDW